MPPGLPRLESGRASEETDIQEEIKHLTLGSRKNLCINPSVNKLHSMTAVNERCMELQQSSTPADKRCKFLPNKDNAALVSSFRDHTLASIRDIEDMGNLGKKLEICPYYASREVIKPSEIVTLPYPLLLQKSARDALGISLKGHVVIVDEAHNLMDAIAGIYSVSISLSQLKGARKGLGIYLQKFKNKLKGQNRVYVAQVVRLQDSLIGFLEGKAGTRPAEGGVEASQLLAGKGVDQINLYKLLRYLQESKLARKVESYMIYAEKQVKMAGVAGKAAQDLRSEHEDPTAPTLQHMASLLVALTNPSREGQLFYSYSSATPLVPAEITLKYTLLDPTHHFQVIVSDARAVILAGGTMSPMTDYMNHLLPYLPLSKLTTLSCGHVIPKENLVAWALSTGPTGRKFEFTYGNRGGSRGDEMIDELGRAILNIAAVVPDGVVIFFPSYAYLETAVQKWSQAVPGTSNLSIWERLGNKKALFRENKEAKGGNDVLSEYAQAIDQGKGGLLFSVVGGKMSEGINFSDALGRCVIIVGLPFPNIMSGEWKAKLAYIEATTEERLETAGVSAFERKEQAKKAGREFYENACMRAVNQSVGRAIRHKGDYASIVMVDSRFGSERIKGKLPGWIRDGLDDEAHNKPFDELMRRLGSFYRSKKAVH